MWTHPCSKSIIDTLRFAQIQKQYWSHIHNAAPLPLIFADFEHLFSHWGIYIDRKMFCLIQKLTSI